MTRVVIKGLAARPLRTLLSALAIVVGVAFVCAALTFTGALRDASDSLSSAAYDGTDAVVTAISVRSPAAGCQPRRGPGASRPLRWCSPWR